MSNLEYTPYYFFNENITHMWETFIAFLYRCVFCVLAFFQFFQFLAVADSCCLHGHSWQRSMDTLISSNTLTHLASDVVHVKEAHLEGVTRCLLLSGTMLDVFTLLGLPFFCLCFPGHGYFFILLASSVLAPDWCLLH